MRRRIPRGLCVDINAVVAVYIYIYIKKSNCVQTIAIINSSVQKLKCTSRDQRILKHTDNTYTHSPEFSGLLIKLENIELNISKLQVGLNKNLILNLLDNLLRIVELFSSHSHKSGY